MSKYFGSYHILKKIILVITEEIVMVTTVRIVWVEDFKHVVYELSVPSAKIGGPEADSDNSHLSEIFYRKTFLLLQVLIELYYIVIGIYLINLSLLGSCRQDGKTY